MKDFGRLLQDMEGADMKAVGRKEADRQLVEIGLAGREPVNYNFCCPLSQILHHLLCFN
jgi:hypothetical protein